MAVYSVPRSAVHDLVVSVAFSVGWGNLSFGDTILKLVFMALL